MESFKYYNHLGFHNPYYSMVDGRIVLFPTFKEAINSIKGKRLLDISSVIDILCTGYILGDKTIVQGISKTPWMAKPNKDMTDWEFFAVPPHGENVNTIAEISEKLFELLKVEVYEYIKDFNNIGILLTGGMDSRIVACVLNELLSSGEVKDKKVTAITWGKEDSRDVEYARRIAKLFDWRWKHILVNERQMAENIEICVERGCEYSPLHLHGMSKVSDIVDIDCVLAGSFGDSIGRGEYSGSHVENIKELTGSLRNFGGWVSKNLVKNGIQRSKAEVSRYHKQFPQKKRYQQLEQDYQLHYLRRMLNPCMSVIDEKKPLFQVFTSPDVFGFMWSIDPKLRNDRVYETLLKNKCSELLDVPWARTGLRFPEKNGVPDDFTKQHHNYASMIRKCFFDEIKGEINKLNEANLNLFDIKAVNQLFKLCKDKPINNSYYYEEKLFWLSCLSKTIRKFDIEGIKTDKIIRDPIARNLSVIKYNVKYRIR